MRRLRGGPALALAPAPVLLAIGAGWLVIGIVLWLVPRVGILPGAGVSAYVSAAAAWLTIVLAAIAGEEFVEAAAGQDDADFRARQGGWRRPYAPVVAIAAGLALGFALWR